MGRWLAAPCIAVALALLPSPARPDPSLPPEVLRDHALAARDPRTRREPPTPSPLTFTLAEGRLDNGLAYAIAPSALDADVYLEVRYGIGSRDGAASPHTAHLLEHLTYRRTASLPWLGAALVDVAGSDMEGTTGVESTFYEAVVAPEHLERALWIERERMALTPDLVDDETLLRERDLVAHEVMLASLRWPHLRHLAIRSAFPAGHPWREELPSRESVRAVTADAVRALLAERHVPSNARITLAGAVAPREAEAMIRRLFGSLPTRPAPTPREAAFVRYARGDRRVQHRTVYTPTVALVWAGPAVDPCDDALLVASLDQLSRALSRDPGMRAFARPRAHWSVGDVSVARQHFLYFEASVHDGPLDATDALARMDAALTRALDAFDGPTPLDGDVVPRLRDGLVDEASDLRRRGRRIADHPRPDDPGGFRCADARLRELPPADVRDWIRTWITDEREVHVFETARWPAVFEANGRGP